MYRDLTKGLHSPLCRGCMVRSRPSCCPVNDQMSPAGDLVYLNVLGQRILAVNALRPTLDFLEKKSSNLSGRPNSVLFNLYAHPLAYTPSAHTTEHDLSEALASQITSYLCSMGGSGASTVAQRIAYPIQVPYFSGS